MTVQIEPQRQKFLAERLRLFSSKQPDLTKLRAKLLELGGLDMVPAPENDLSHVKGWRCEEE